MSLVDAAIAGDRLETLRVLRNMLSVDLDVCESMRDKAALAQRLMDVLGQIAEVEKAAPKMKGTVLDELAKRRTDSKPAARKTRATRAK